MLKLCLSWRKMIDNSFENIQIKISGYVAYIVTFCLGIPNVGYRNLVVIGANQVTAPNINH